MGPRLKLEADVVTVSHDHENHSYVRAVGRDPYVIDGPGEYEVAGVVVTGLPGFHDSHLGEEHGRNTIYVIEIDDVRVCHLGDLGHALDDDTLGAVGNIDLLLVPVGGGQTLDATRAAEVVRQVEPRVVVPMHFALPAIKKQLEPVDRFLKEMGVEAVQAQPKLTLTASSSGDDETRLVLLDARA